MGYDGKTGTDPEAITEWKDLFTLYINCYDVHEVCCEGTKYRQILFDGRAEGEAFNGKILPGGVDTQIEYPDGSGSLSARYMLEGTDGEGALCHMYIDNSAALGEETTHPKILSDSRFLRRLKDVKLKGRMINDDDGLRIIIKAEADRSIACRGKEGGIL
ncbi:MAG: DUF3237 family protein [Lachnospiraceae bacterium]|nr:DUF3237 family protein [Lachnospiraceae bacterium]